MNPRTLRALPDATAEPTISVERGAAVFGVSRAGAYVKVANGEWPSLRAGRRIVLPTARWLAAVGLAETT